MTNGDDPTAPVDVEQWYYRYGVIAATHWVARYHRTRLEGSPLPVGPCIYVTHHGAGYLNLDLAVAVYRLGWDAWYERRGPPSGLRIGAAAGHAIERVIPGLATMKRLAGLVPANEENCLKVLARGMQLLLTPGGRRESTPRARDYRLRWSGRMGYVRVALKAGVPIVPLAVVGGFAAYPGLAWRTLSFWSPVPLPVRIDVAVGAPIAVPQGVDPGVNPEIVNTLHLESWSATQALYDRVLARRNGRTRAPVRERA